MLMRAATVVQVLRDLFYVLLHVLIYLRSILKRKHVGVSLGVGYVPGSCHSTRLTPNNDYIVIAEVQATGAGGRLQVRPVDTEIAATSRNINQVTSACRLRPKYPHG